MSETRRAIEHEIGRVLKPLEYTKRGATWHREREQVVSVVNLQKSQWGDSWYVNLGVFVKALGNESRPVEARCHVRCRADAVGARPIPEDPRGIAALVGEIAVPFLDELGTEGGIRAFLRSKRASLCLIDRSVTESLGPDSGTPAP